VFGKNDTNAINLSTIESGTGGFAINNDITADSDAGAGASVSSAGDVNGDGLDDLIIGAYRAQNSSGKSFFVFGKKDNRDVVNLSAIESGTGGFVLITKPPVPVTMFDRLMASVSALPNTT
jgi:hypothetical protein